VALKSYIDSSPPSPSTQLQTPHSPSTFIDPHRNNLAHALEILDASFGELSASSPWTRESLSASHSALLRLRSQPLHQHQRRHPTAHRRPSTRANLISRMPLGSWTPRSTSFARTDARVRKAVLTSAMGWRRSDRMNGCPWMEMLADAVLTTEDGLLAAAQKVHRRSGVPETLRA
jgi:hypothetical protein